ncbi:cupin domain-containing protein [Cystobacter fuscus]|uniref:cupin domain-containing protein n=1 Tax=Cystobacter fuscus TaxID=43 RepID=UPI0002AE51E1|nr:cupin domain-containing protein [Cystobacter fuscus]
MFHLDRHFSLGGALFTLDGILEAFGGRQAEPGFLERPTALPEALRGQSMIVYSPRRRVDESLLRPLGPPEDIGGEVLEGNPVLSARVDFSEQGMMAGIFKSTTGKVRIHFPFTEHATILEGEVTLTDETKQTRTLKKGDSYFIRQGQTVVWDVKGKHVIKSFFNITR